MSWKNNYEQMMRKNGNKMRFQRKKNTYDEKNQ